ncbi:MAG: helix-turn-helix transcriptional regulator [Verrucomicrobiota bacterium]|jgi:transcriptional regulator with XRE-family HTH domain
MQNKQFAARLAESMKKSGFTQRSLAKAVGISQPTVSRLLKGTLPALAVGIHLSTVLNVDHGWLIEGVARWPEIKFDDGMRRRLLKARHLEGMEVADIARLAAIPEQTFAAVENGNQVPTPAMLEKWIACLNVEERFILEGRGRMFKAESRFILIPPDEIEQRKQELQRLRDHADFLARRVERLDWELAESIKVNRAGPYHPRIVNGVRKRATWED